MTDNLTSTFISWDFFLCGHLLTDFIRVPLLCFFSKKIFAAFIHHQAKKRLIVPGPVTGNRNHVTLGLLDNFLNMVGPHLK